MIQTSQNVNQLPLTLEEFLLWEPNDGFKYEWNDGELIRFSGLKIRHLYIFAKLSCLFVKQGFHDLGTLITKPEVMLSVIQLRKPDIAYFTREQVYKGRQGTDVIPEFVIEIISEGDLLYKVEEKLAEYFKSTVQVVWHIYPENQVVYVYTSRKSVKICTDDDICSASPVLPDFEITVNELFALPTLP